LYCPENQKTQLAKGLKKGPQEIRKLKIFDNVNFADIDFFFSPMYSVPEVIAKQDNINKCLFLHDAIPLLYPEYFVGHPMQWYYDMFQSLNNNDFYFTNSISTQNDFMKLNKNITRDNSAVALLACDKIFKPSKYNLKQVCKKYNIPTDKKYVFSLCTLEPRKNLIRSVKTFIEFIKKNKIDDMVYVLGGGQWAGFMEKLNAEFDELGKYKDKILQAGYVDKEDLPTLYSGATFFVYTSQYEGFGLPPLEAMQCGCPVIASNNSSLPEVVGDAGIMIDWDSDEQHIAAYEKYYFDEKYREEMAKKGLERSKQFSWKNTVDVVEKQIKDRLNKKNGPNKQKTNNKINLLIDANILANAATKGTMRSGVFFVVYNVLTELKKQNKFNLFLYVDNEKLGDVISVIESDDNLQGLSIATAANLDEMDVFLSPHADIPDHIVRIGHIRAYKITYDFMGCVFDDKIFSTRLANHQRAMFTCQKQFCISESTKQDYLKFVPQINPDNLIVTHLAANDRFCRAKAGEITYVRKKYNINGNYILSVCNLAPHKNLFMAIDAFVDFIKKNKIKDLNYVLCGGIPKFYEEEFAKKMESLGKYAKNIILTGYADDADIPVLYSGAEFFVFPSLYEGFGLPILEAMQCGTPVVCSNTSSMPEIIGDCGITVSPDNKEEFVAAFGKMHDSESFRKKCSTAGLKRAKEFSWGKMCDIITRTIIKDCSVKSPVYPIVLITDENYVKPTIVTITSILVNKYANTNYKIYVLGNSLSYESKKLLQKIDSSVMVVPFKNAFAEFIGTHGHVSAAALLKFKIADLFPQYDKILYLDTDMIIQHDLTELFKIDIRNKYAAVVKDMFGMLDVHVCNKLNLTDYFNSGMMLLNIKKMRNEKTYDKLLDYKLHKDIRRFMDQDCLNVVFNENVIFLSCKYNYMPCNQKVYNNDQVAQFYGVLSALIPKFDLYALIIHLTNKQKPWDYNNVYGTDLWAEYYYKSVLKNHVLKYKDIIKPKVPLKQKIKAKIHSLLHPKKTIKFNSRIFGKDLLFSKIADEYLGGIGVAESWGRWSLNGVSEIKLPLKKTNKDLHFVFKVRVFALGKVINQNVKISVNDKHITDWNFVNGKPLPITEFNIPKDMLKNTKELKIKFEYSNPKSPRDLRMSSDSRNLAIGFESLKITRK
jgi:glycosyltransferase involved in cell wall biosynthesis/lipopolysaccharide biosynthesis glycosyltransferase